MSSLGSKSSRRKRRAARANGHYGGRPRMQKKLRGQIACWRIWDATKKHFVVSEFGRSEWTDRQGALNYRKRLNQRARGFHGTLFVVSVLKNGASPMKDAVEKVWKQEGLC